MQNSYSGVTTRTVEYAGLGTRRLHVLGIPPLRAPRDLQPFFVLRARGLDAPRRGFTRRSALRLPRSAVPRAFSPSTLINPRCRSAMFQDENADASHRRSRDEVAHDCRRLTSPIGQSEPCCRRLSRYRAIGDAGNLKLAHRRWYDRHAEFRGHEVDD